MKKVFKSKAKRHGPKFKEERAVGTACPSKDFIS